MSGFKRIPLYLACLLVLSACNQKKTEIVIQKDDLIQKKAEEKNSPVSEEKSKPLILIQPGDTALIMVRQDGAPGMYLGEDGKVHGFYVDLEKMVMAAMGQTYRFIPYNDVGPVVQGLKTGECHIALAAPDLPDYRSFLNLSIPYEILHYVTFVQSSNTEVKGTTREQILMSLHGKKVGVQTRGHIYQALRDIREIELVEYPTTTQAMADLDQGLLDAVPDVKRIGMYYAAKEGWHIEPRGVAIVNDKITTAFSKMLDPSLLKRYNKALQTLISDGRLEALYTRYFGKMENQDKPWVAR